MWESLDSYQSLDYSTDFPDSSFYFSQLSMVSNTSLNSMNIVRSTEALDEFKHRLVSSPKRNTIHTHHHSYHTNTDCMYLKKRAYSLTNSNVITQFELENQLNSQIHKIYGSSKEFLANLDQTSLIGTKHEADFATSHNFLTNIENKEFRDLPLPARKDSNVNIKILDKIHTHQNDNILTVFGKFIKFNI